MKLPMFKIQTLFLVLIVIGLYFAALNIDAPLLYLLTAIILSFIVLGWLCSIGSLSKINLKRILPHDPVMANQPISIRYIMQNRALFYRYSISLQDSIQHGYYNQISEQISAWINLIPGKINRELIFNIKLNQRGRYQLGPVILESAYPFGLFSKKKKIILPDEIRIYPELLPISNLPQLTEYYEFLSHESRLFIGQGDDFYTLREYCSGDSLRNIHWKCTARHQELMVREMQRITEPIILLFMDNDIKKYNGQDKINPIYERMIKIASSLTFYLEKHHFKIEFYTQPDIHRTGYRDILDYLSESQMLSCASFSNLLDAYLNYVNPFSTIFLFTTGIDLEIIERIKIIKLRNINPVIFWFGNSDMKYSSENIEIFLNQIYSLTSYCYPIYSDDNLHKIFNK